MPYLVLNGTTVPIDRREHTTDVERIGDAGRAADGTYLSRLHASKRDFRRSTRWQPPAEHAITYALLSSAPPLVLTGDIVSGAPTNVVVEIHAVRDSKPGGVLLRSIDFTLHEE